MKNSPSESRSIQGTAEYAVLPSIPVTDGQPPGRLKGCIAKKMPTKAEITAAVDASSYIKMQELRDSLINILIRRPEGVLRFSDLQTLTCGDVSYDLSNHSFRIRGKTVLYQRDIVEHMQRHDFLREQAMNGFKREGGAESPYFIGWEGKSLFITQALPGLSPKTVAAYVPHRDALLSVLLERYAIGFETLVSWPLAEVQKLASPRGREDSPLRRRFEEVGVAQAFLRAREGLSKVLGPLIASWTKQRVVKANTLAFISLTGESLTGD